MEDSGMDVIPPGLHIPSAQHKASCTTNLYINPRLRLAAQWHTDDIVDNRHLGGTRGSGESTPQNRALAGAHRPGVAEATAINPALAISGIELIDQSPGLREYPRSQRFSWLRDYE
jgi:hypothetical protein